MEEALKEGEKRMGIILKQMSCRQEPHEMAMTVCVNYTQLDSWLLQTRGAQLTEAAAP